MLDKTDGRRENHRTGSAFRLWDGAYREGYRNGVAMYEPDEDEVVEQGGARPRLPGWARRPQWLPSLGRRPSRAAAILGIAGLTIGLAAGYALGDRHLGQAARPSPATPPRATPPGATPPGATPPGAIPPGAAAADAVPSAVAGFAAPVYPPPPPGGPAYSSNLGITVLSGLAQTGGACSVQRGRELQVGVEVINLSETAVTLGSVRPILPLGGLRLVSQQWAPCGALSPSWPAADGGMIVFIKSSTGVVEVGSTTPGSAAVLPPNGTAWLSATFRVLVACPSPLQVQFSVSYQENGRTDTAHLAGFPDLAQVTYTGCKGSS